MNQDWKRKWMNQDWKRKWVTALRSREYKQGRGALRQGFQGDDLYCCLGVLGDLVAPKEWSKSTDPDGRYRHNLGYDNLSYHIFDKVWMSPETSDRLVDMNDSGKSFIVIAKWIEENL